MVATFTCRLGDQSARAPREVVDQSNASTRSAISPTAGTPGRSELSGNGIERRQHPVWFQDFTTRVPGTKLFNPAAAVLVPGPVSQFLPFGEPGTTASRFPRPAPCAITRRNEAPRHREQTTEGAVPRRPGSKTHA